MPRPGPRRHADHELAAVARRAAEIIVERGKATGVEEDEQGRVCTFGAVIAAEEALNADTGITLIRWICMHPDVLDYAYTGKAPASPASRVLSSWSDLPTTTELDIAKVFLQVADEIDATDA